jgi:hypothetical protein
MSANLMFGADGVGHKAVFPESATSMTLVVTVHAGSTRKSASLDFEGDAAHEPS